MPATAAAREEIATRQLASPLPAVRRVERPAARHRCRNGSGGCQAGGEREPVPKATKPRSASHDVDERERVELPHELQDVLPRPLGRKAERVCERGHRRTQRSPGMLEHERRTRIERPRRVPHAVLEPTLLHAHAGCEVDGVPRCDHARSPSSPRRNATIAPPAPAQQSANAIAGSGMPSDASRGATSPTASDVAIAVAPKAAKVES